MVATKRLGNYSGSNSDDSLTRNGDDGVEAMLRKRKQRKTTTTTTTLVPSSASNMNWSKNDELVILGGVVDYENETELSYRSDWDAFYLYIKGSVEASFSKKQLIDKVKHLKRKFTYNQARSNDGKELSFTDTDDDEIFKLSMRIWANNEGMDQAKDVPCAEQESKENKDVPCAEQENMDVPCAEQENKDVPCAEQENKDVPCAEQERVSIEIDNGEKEKSEEDGVEKLYVQEETLESGISFQNLGKNGEKEKSEEDGVDELGVLQEILEADTFFQNLGSRYQQKLMLKNLENVGVERRKELIDEWKALCAEEMQLFIKKLTFFAKLANGGVSP